jgi:hypothetical protein|tara:strand:- start:130 stop:315 length:186 start_codon:yes stop_codon:yes gene_type:complete
VGGATRAVDNGAGFVDVLPALIQFSANDVLHCEKDGHATPAGYAIIAKEAHDYLTLARFVP